MDLGPKIYYEKSTGNVIKDLGPKSGGVRETTQEQDFESYLVLAERYPETVGVVKFPFEKYKQDYEAGGAIERIDLESMEPLFTYPDPINPEVPPNEPRPPLSMQVTALEEETAALNLAIIDLWETIANGGAA
ncbi:hypothetical protein [Paenibacillus xylanexedens]|uniref:hypothetical protein n=1 Tax=Paenibacillus xylanexedens TaxID=528191 RepID=UPI00119E437B|nr:hypothetical protein [Paenibacillus xylanexedens]